MGLFDAIKGSFGGAFGQAESAALPAVLTQVFPNGMQGVLDQLQQTGFGSHISSWLGNGPNQPISVDQLRSALNDEHVQQIAQSLGIPTDKALEFLSAHLPAAVDQQSPQGTLQPDVAAGGQA